MGNNRSNLSSCNREHQLRNQHFGSPSHVMSTASSTTNQQACDYSTNCIASTGHANCSEVWDSFVQGDSSRRDEPQGHLCDMSRVFFFQDLQPRLFAPQRHEGTTHTRVTNENRHPFPHPLDG